MRRPKIKNKWMILGAVNVLVILFSAMMIYCSHQDNVVAAFNYQDESEHETAFIYSTSEMKRGVYEAKVSYKIGGGAIHIVL